MPLAKPERDRPGSGPPAPLDDIYVDFLMSKRRETPDLDFKWRLDFSPSRFADVAKDVFAMANYGGGYIVAGFKETGTGTFEPTGLPSGFHFDQADLQQKFSAYSHDPHALGYREFEYLVDGEARLFAIVYVPPSTTPLYPKSDGIVRKKSGKEKRVFRRGTLLIRRGTQSIRASSSEREFIKKRSQDTEYQTALISGVPDEVTETIYSNLFPVRRLPGEVYSARVVTKDIPFQAKLNSPFVCKFPYLYSFLRPNEQPIGPVLVADSTQKQDIEGWLADQDSRRTLLWLLRETVVWEGRQRGMYADGSQLYFPLEPDEGQRTEDWLGIARESSRTVAWRKKVPALGGTVGVHRAVSVRFLFLRGDELYLRLLPSYVITKDGKHVRRGEREGAIITSLGSTDYNAEVLRDVFFWISKMGAASGTLFLAKGRIEIASLPVTGEMEMGLRSDGFRLSSLDLRERWGREG